MRHRQVLTYVGGEFASTHYTEWGATDNPDVVCCVHGLTRNCRDFDELAQSLSDRFRVVCVDVVGRGRSDWLRDARQYHYGSYVSQLACVIAHLNVQRLQWVGTSMGGILGMFLAAAPRTPISRMVISDVGPVIPKQALAAIAAYLGKAPSFASVDEVEQYLHQVHAGFGALTDEQWRHLAEHSARDCDGSWRLHYDPAIAAAFAAISGDVDLTSVWQQVNGPVLVLRGAESTLLTAETAAVMAQRENVRVDEFAGVGHAPMMMSADQIARVREFLCQH